MSDADSGGTLVVYSDYVCPFCYLGRAALREYLASAADPPRVDWRCFDLRGYKRGPAGTVDFDADDGKDDAYFERVRENVRRLEERYGVSVSLDVARRVDSQNAQQAALHVRRTLGEDAFTAFHHAVFDALWNDGRDIGDPEVLADVAGGVGIDPAEVRAGLADESVASALSEAFAAAERAGVTGIPTFVYDGHVARGAVPPTHLRRLVEGGDPGSPVGDRTG